MKALLIYTLEIELCMIYSNDKGLEEGTYGYGIPIT